MQLDVRGLHEVQRIMRNLPDKEIPYAISVAINKTLYPVSQAEKSEIKSVFDRPTAFIVRGVGYQKSTKSNLTAKVFLREQAQPVLESHVESGQRTVKEYEGILKRYGILPPGKYTVIASGAKLDQYGNITRAERTKIMDAVPGLAATGRSGKYFLSTKSGRTSHLTAGVWEKIGIRIVPIFVFVSNATYQKRYAFYEVGIDKAKELIGQTMVDAAEIAIQRARQ